MLQKLFSKTIIEKMKWPSHFFMTKELSEYANPVFLSEVSKILYSFFAETHQSSQGRHPTDLLNIYFVSSRGFG